MLYNLRQNGPVVGKFFEFNSYVMFVCGKKYVGILQDS